MAPASDPAEIPLDASDDEKRGAILSLCTRLLPGWGAVSPGQLELTAISGGISNLLVKVTPAEHAGLSPVAVKVFGNKTELLIDRKKELEQLLKLNSCGFGAEVVGIFANGRVEAFLTAKTLTPTDMLSSEFVPRIAALLRKLHSVPTDGVPTLWSTIDQWLSMAQALSFDDPAKQAKFVEIDFEAQRREIDELQALCERVPTEVVFSHNDLLSGNILIVHESSASDDSASEGTMQFIDYEYSDCGYRGFDFGNHFNEYAGFECDYTRYPGRDAQRSFFRAYLAADSSSADADAASDAQLERLEAEANVFALASHVYWGVWSLIQARYSPIDFDYLEYSHTRWAEYHRRKTEFVSQARRVFGLQ